MSDRHTPMDDNLDEGAPLPERIVTAARELRAPPPTPREEIWLRVQAARRKSAPAADVIPIESRRPFRGAARGLAWGAGIAAVLALGIGLGRMSMEPESSGPAVVSSAPGDSAVPRSLVAYTVATGQHLSRVETFLTTLRLSSELDSSFAVRARDLLTSTRLLQDAPGLDPRLRRLLSDLEDILVQVAQFDRSRGAEELDLITDGLEERQVLPRIRTAVPVGPPQVL